MSADRVSSAVASQRLSQADSRLEQRFTVARDAAILQQRAAVVEPWGWTLHALRAIASRAEHVVLRVEVLAEPTPGTLRLTFATADEGWSALELGELRAFAIEPDRGLGPAADAERVAAHRRRLLGRAINEALAGEPQTLVLRTPAGSRRWTRGPAMSTGEVYREVRSGERRAGAVEIELVPAARGLGSLWTRWRGRDNPVADIETLWRDRFVGELERTDDETLVATRFDDWIELGTTARLRFDPGAGGAWLVRDGLRIARLDPLATSSGLPPAAWLGFVDAPDLHSTADGRGVVEDAAAQHLVAWLHDVVAHRREDGTLGWPTSLSSVNTTDGSRSLDELARRAEAGTPVPFVWAHDARPVPPGLGSEVLRLRAHEHALLSVALPNLRLHRVDELRSLAERPAFDPRSIASTTLGVVPLESFTVDGEQVPETRVDGTLAVHRRAGELAPGIVIVAMGRQLGHAQIRRKGWDGVTLMAELRESTAIDAWTRDRVGLERIAERISQHAAERRDDAFAMVVEALSGSAAVFDVPVVIGAIQAFGPRLLELHYREDAAGLARLHGRAHPLLGAAVGVDRQGATVRLADVLDRVATVGGLVVGTTTRRWFTLESSDRSYATTVLSDATAIACTRLFGAASLWRMPVVPAARPHPAPARGQSQLVLGSDEIGRLLARIGTDEHARAILLGHVLVARVLGRSELALESKPLVRRYDPRAHRPMRLVSVQELEAEPLAIVPMGAAGRDLPEPVVEATPGEAALLHEVLGLRLAPPRAPDDRLDTAPRPRTSIRPKSRPTAAPVIEQTIADPRAVGTIAFVDAQRRGTIELWAEGLRVGDLQLPPPLQALEGRLVLTAAGIAGGSKAAREIVLEAGSKLVEALRGRVPLFPPNSPAEAMARGLLANVDRLLADTPAAAEEADAIVLPAPASSWLVPLLRRALRGVGGVAVDTAWLSWSLCDPGPSDRNPWRIEIGRRNRFVRAALAREAEPRAVFVAVLLVIGELVRRAPERAPSLSLLLRRILTAARGNLPARAWQTRSR